MAWPQETLKIIKRLNVVKRNLNDIFVNREVAIDLLMLAAVCQEHLLLIGLPGTAKTQLAAEFSKMINARGFHYLLTRFTEPSEMFGPLDLVKFQDGTYNIRTTGMLPEAQVVFLDEVFQGSSAILNTLLTIINERIFHNGSIRQKVPLLSMIGATNLLPEDPWLHAFSDRFALRCHMDPVAEEHMDALLIQGWELEKQRIEDARDARLTNDTQGQVRERVIIEVGNLLELHDRLSEVDITQFRPVYLNVVKELRAEGVDISDRRVIKGLKLAAGAALLRGAEAVEVRDLWPLNYFWSRMEEAETARNVIQPKVEEGGGAPLEMARPAAEIMEDIEVLERQEASARTEVAIGAHLMALNRLRREILKSHRGNQELIRRIEQSIQNNLIRLEGVHHV